MLSQRQGGAEGLLEKLQSRYDVSEISASRQ